MQDSRFRITIILLAILAVCYLLWPTYKFYSLTEDKKNELSESSLERLNKRISLGLDLQGGLYILLETDIPLFVEKLATEKPIELMDAIQKAKQLSEVSGSNFFDEFLILANDTTSGQKKLRLKRYFDTIDSQNDNESVVNKLLLRCNNSISGNLEVLRNRIDKLGVSEPTIRSSGTDRIIIELAGVKDIEHAKETIRNTGTFECSLLFIESQFSTLIESIDSYLLSDSSRVLFNEVPLSEEKQTKKSDYEDRAEKLLRDQIDQSINADQSINNFTTSEDILKENPFSGYLMPVPEGIGIMDHETIKVREILENPRVRSIIGQRGRLLWGKSVETVMNTSGTGVIKYQPLYYVGAKPIIEGGMIRNPIPRMGAAGTDESGRWTVDLEMRPKAAKDWSRFTGSNIGRRVAIILDDIVYIAPQIQNRIPNGMMIITGLDDMDEAKLITTILEAGEMQAPMKIEQMSIIGPSLGRDSIQSGKKAMLGGLIAVIIFMIIYYKGAGLLAATALLFNLILVVAILSPLEATLTLPGIAGLILTIGMSVDANVIIFERIREELDLGKTVRAAINAGYERAFITILDANVTTLIAAFVLVGFGSGPIKGFAVTLSAGIICSMFTAIFFTRSIFMAFTNRKPRQSLSI